MRKEDDLDRSQWAFGGHRLALVQNRSLASSSGPAERRETSGLPPNNGSIPSASSMSSSRQATTPPPAASAANVATAKPPSSSPRKSSAQRLAAVRRQQSEEAYYSNTSQGAAPDSDDPKPDTASSRALPAPSYSMGKTPSQRLAAKLAQGSSSADTGRGATELGSNISDGPKPASSRAVPAPSSMGKTPSQRLAAKLAQQGSLSSSVDTTLAGRRGAPEPGAAQQNQQVSYAKRKKSERNAEMLAACAAAARSRRGVTREGRASTLARLARGSPRSSPSPSRRVSFSDDEDTVHDIPASPSTEEERRELFYDRSDIRRFRSSKQVVDLRAVREEEQTHRHRSEGDGLRRSDTARAPAQDSGGDGPPLGRTDIATTATAAASSSPTPQCQPPGPDTLKNDLDSDSPDTRARQGTNAGADVLAKNRARDEAASSVPVRYPRQDTNADADVAAKDRAREGAAASSVPVRYPSSSRSSQRNNSSRRSMTMLPAGDINRSVRRDMTSRGGDGRSSSRSELAPPPVRPGATAVRGISAASSSNNSLSSFSHQPSRPEDGGRDRRPSYKPEASTPQVVAHLVTEDEERRENNEELVHAVAKKDSFLELLRHDRQTKIIAVIVVAAVIGLGAFLGVTLSRPPQTSPSSTASAEERYVTVGTDIDGPGDDFEYGPGDFSMFGSSVSMSGNGTRIAIGAPEYTIIRGDPPLGLVQVFDERDGEWSLLGPTILGEGFGDRTGTSVALSVDGTTLAVGSPGHSGGGGRGQVKVYRRNDDDESWEQLGRTIMGEAAEEELGSHVAISEDGGRVAISIPGRVRQGNEFAVVFEFVNDEWVQLGDDLEGRFGGSPISMSADGNVVALGSLSTEENDFSGAVRVYEYASGFWRLRGADIILKGAVGFSDTCWMPSISADGKTVAVGSSVLNSKVNGEEYDLLVRVFRFDDGAGDWSQLGDTLHDKKGPHLISYVASLSGDSSVLAIGDPGGFAMGVNSGHSHVLRFIDDNWVHVDKELEGFDAADLFGQAVSVSFDGRRVGIGAPQSRAMGSERGRVSVFALSELMG